MNPFVRQLVNHKINNLEPSDLIRYANIYQIPLTQTQAVKVIKIFRQQAIDIDNKQQRSYLLKLIGKEVGPDVQKKVSYIVDQFLA